MPDDQLEPLITECPSCQTRFRVSEPQLERARGRVRCGACLTVFHGGRHLVLASLTRDEDPEKAQQALDDLLDELAGYGGDGQDAQPPRVDDQRGVPPKPAAARDERRRTAIFAGFEEPPEAGRREDPAGREPVAGEQSVPAERRTVTPSGKTSVEQEVQQKDVQQEEVQQKDVQQDLKPDRKPAPEAAPSPAERSTPEAAPPPAERPAPATAGKQFAPVTFGQPRRRRPLVWLGILAGLVLLVGQVLWYQFDDWSGEPQWRPVYASICSVLGCELPVRRDAAQLTTRNLIVRTHPDEVKALLVNAVIVNRADFAQPFPVLELQFTTVRGNLAASRRFAPEDYLAGDASGMDLMPPRTPVQIELTMDDPGPDAVNYRLNFH